MRRYRVYPFLLSDICLSIFIYIDSYTVCHCQSCQFDVSDEAVRVRTSIVDCVISDCRVSLVLSTQMTSTELVVVFEVVDRLGQWPMSRLGQRQRQEAAHDGQDAEDNERQLPSDVSAGVRLGQIVDVRVEDAAEPAGERAHPRSRVPADTQTDAR